MDYPLCVQTVTVYRLTPEGVSRQVIEGCFYSYRIEEETDEWGKRQETTFLLVVPGEVQHLCIGDRIFDGVGPEITAQQWQSFLPVQVPGLSQVEYLRPCYRDGRLCHTEAGKK